MVGGCPVVEDWSYLYRDRVARMRVVSSSGNRKGYTGVRQGPNEGRLGKTLDGLNTGRISRLD